MKIFLQTLLIFTALAINSCSEKGDAYYIQKEREQLNGFLEEDKVVFYKTIKTFAKFSIAGKSNTSLMYKSDFDKLETTHLDKVSKRLASQTDSNQSSSMLDEATSYYKAYTEYQKMKEFAVSVDEDSLPSFLELFSVNSTTSTNSNDTSIIDNILKDYVKNLEHVIFGFSLFAPQQLPESLCLYELEKVKMEKLGSNDIRSVAQCIKGFLLSQYHFNYLSELEFTDNINQLNDESFIAILLKPVVPSQRPIHLSNKEKVKLELINVNLICRALARVSMDKEYKKDLAFQDCELFLQNAEKLWICYL